MSGLFLLAKRIERANHNAIAYATVLCLSFLDFE